MSPRRVRVAQKGHGSATGPAASPSTSMFTYAPVWHARGGILSSGRPRARVGTIARLRAASRLLSISGSLGTVRRNTRTRVDLNSEQVQDQQNAKRSSTGYPHAVDLHKASGVVDAIRRAAAGSPGCARQTFVQTRSWCSRCLGWGSRAAAAHPWRCARRPGARRRRHAATGA